MMKLCFYTRTQITLSAEDFHNKGISREEVKKAILSVCGPMTIVTAAGINGNWNFIPPPSDSRSPEEIVFTISEVLMDTLDGKTKNIWDYSPFL